MNIKKSLLVILCLLMCVAFFAGCNFIPASTANPASPVVLPPSPSPSPAPSPTPTLSDELGQAAVPIAFDSFPALDGSTACIPLAVALMQYYSGISREEAEESIIFSTTDYSYAALIEGSADLLLVYEAADVTKDEIAETGIELEYYPIGRDALVFLLSEGNPVDSLSNEQLIDIYSGAITNWKDLGGEDLPIIPVQRTEKSGSQTMMKKLVMGNTPLMDAPSEMMPGEMGMLIDMLVEFTPTSDAIGYSVYYYVSRMYQRPNLKLLAVNGIAPSSDSIARGEYPFVNDFFAVIRADSPEGSPERKIAEFLTTDEGKRVMEVAGYVPIE